MLRAAFLSILVGLSACVSTDAPIDPDVSLAFAPIGPVDAEEVRAVVEREVAQARVCMRIPPVWWQRHMVVRFGPPNWRGLRIPADAEARLNDFVEMGFWTREDLAEDGVNLVRFQLTELGAQSIRGEPYYGTGRFCPPGERRLVRILETTRLAAEPSPPFPGFDPHGSERLRVRFEWIGVETPSWLPTAELRERYAARLPQHEQILSGGVTLYRVWRRDEHPLTNAPHSGALQPFCYDSIHNLLEECAVFGRPDR